MHTKPGPSARPVATHLMCLIHGASGVFKCQMATTRSEHQPVPPKLGKYNQFHQLQWFGQVLRKAPTQLTMNPEREISPFLSNKKRFNTMSVDVDALGLAATYGLYKWNLNRVNLGEDLASDHRQWAADIRCVCVIHEARSSPGDSGIKERRYFRPTFLIDRGQLTVFPRRILQLY